MRSFRFSDGILAAVFCSAAEASLYFFPEGHVLLSRRTVGVVSTRVSIPAGGRRS